jgi:chromatin segregation and condensation protein Rec8/ScpA/Scc1 (kleisin family)
MDLISRSQFITAFCDLPSTGEGFEIAAMLFEFKCPVLAVAQHESKVSDFIEGVQHHLFEFERYTMMSDALDMMREFETRRLIQIQQQYLPLFGPPKPARPIVATLAQGGEV